MISDSEIIDFLSSQGQFIEYLGENETHNEIAGFCSLKNLKNHCVTWIKKESESLNELFYGYEGILVITEQPIRIKGDNIRCIVVSHAKKAYFRILEHYFKQKNQADIASTAIVESQYISEDVVIGHFSHIGPEVKIGKGTRIGDCVSIVNACEIGENTIIHSGVRIGTDGYGYFIDENNIPEKVPHFGGVKIGNRVEIGANTCIDRGTIDDTIIEDDVKIDNLCHIAHNVKIGRGAMIVAQGLICGSVDIGERAYVAPGAVIKNQLMVGEDAFIGMGAVVIKDVEGGTVVAGVPAVKHRKVSAQDK